MSKKQKEILIPIPTFETSEVLDAELNRLKAEQKEEVELRKKNQERLLPVVGEIMYHFVQLHNSVKVVARNEEDLLLDVFLRFGQGELDFRKYFEHETGEQSIPLLSGWKERGGAYVFPAFKHGSLRARTGYNSNKEWLVVRSVWPEEMFVPPGSKGWFAVYKSHHYTTVKSLIEAILKDISPCLKKK